ncbi:MAG: aldehyde dehydrogenase family protein [Rhodospirillales bacterium]|nr:aldehyde dehydrogenase family protein [Rhodospirillales bacterium]
MIHPAHRTISAATGLSDAEISGGDLTVFSPVDGAMIGAVRSADASGVETFVGRARRAFAVWRAVPAPIRGELVRLLGEELRAAKDDLGRLVSLESGKILAEGRGEVQEMIDICDFAVGLSRQLYGLTMASERPGHHMREVWHPIGPVAVITAFNFPVAVWAWNAALALVCGDSVVWKPSEKTPLTALACQKIFDRAMARFRAGGHDAPDHLSQVLIGGREVGAALVDHPDVPLVSATGSTAMGRAVARRVADRLGRSLLELGGNNAMIVAPSADLSLAVRAIVFGAVGTAGQRCTTLRRLIVHESVRAQLLPALVSAYESLKIGSPLSPETLVGPLIDKAAFEAMQDALMQARDLCGGTILCGGDRVDLPGLEGGYYVRPAIVDMPAQTGVMLHETFAPILYVVGYTDFDAALAIQNGVTQGLSSCIFTNDLAEAEAFASARGSDCGIANVNIGPSGAEIGGAFGGEKDTGGGRESGSDSWKAYMRRQTQTVNFSGALPLAQGVEFGI